MVYYVKNQDGHYLLSNFVFTQIEERAAIFKLDDLKDFDLDGCTLYKVITTHWYLED